MAKEITLSFSAGASKNTQQNNDEETEYYHG